METARGGANGTEAISTSNRLYYEATNSTFKTEDSAAYGDKTYTVTQIRPNNN
jgi:hypothetical protein